MLTVVVPVGPNPVYKEYLQECLDSLKMQSITPGEVILIDDMANLSDWGLDFGSLCVRIHKNPWLCGCAHSFNFGVALAKYDLVLMLGSDDRLHPWAIEDFIKAWNAYKDPLGYYWCDVEYSDGETQATACNSAMVHKKMWELSGGFPIQSSVGACDTILISILLKNRQAGHLIHVHSEKPPYWYRRHMDTLTARTSYMQSAVRIVRDILTETWQKPNWTNGRKYEWSIKNSRLNHEEINSST